MATDSARICPSEVPLLALRDTVVFPLTLQNGDIHVIVEGLQRARADLTTRTENSLRAMVRLAYLVSSLLDMKADEQQQILETETLIDKLRSVESALNREVSPLELKGTIESAAQAVQKLKMQQTASVAIKGPNLCFVGPPGVGKTSLGQSVARAMNPVFMLDEIDKISAGYQGDPSKVLFIATSNQLGTIHPALLDRMEIIQLSGYSEADTLHIAKRYLAPRQVLEHGLTPEQVTLDDEAIRRIASDYTREAGGDVLFVEASLLPAGTITISGLVLPVGGIREKALAAKRFGITTLIHPSRNSAASARVGRSPRQFAISHR